MNKNKNKRDDGEMRSGYDLSELKNRVRGKYVKRYNEGTNLILLGTCKKHFQIPNRSMTRSEC